MTDACDAAIFSAGQVVAAQALGADYAAPYLHTMNDAGKQVGDLPDILHILSPLTATVHACVVVTACRASRKSWR